MKEEAGLAQLNTFLSCLAHTTPSFPVTDVQWLLKSPSALLPLAEEATKEVMLYSYGIHVRAKNLIVSFTV